MSSNIILFTLSIGSLPSNAITKFDVIVVAEVVFYEDLNAQRIIDKINHEFYYAELLFDQYGSMITVHLMQKQASNVGNNLIQLCHCQGGQVDGSLGRISSSRSRLTASFPSEK